MPGSAEVGRTTSNIGNSGPQHERQRDFTNGAMGWRPSYGDD